MARRQMAHCLVGADRGFPPAGERSEDHGPPGENAAPKGFIDAWEAQRNPGKLRQLPGLGAELRKRVNLGAFLSWRSLAVPEHPLGRVDHVADVRDDAER